MTTPPPDNLSRNFYQSPVILGRTPTGPSSRPETQREEVSRTIATKPPETKPSLKTKPLERPFAKMIDEKGTINQEIVGRVCKKNISGYGENARVRHAITKMVHVYMAQHFIYDKVEL